MPPHSPSSQTFVNGSAAGPLVATLRSWLPERSWSQLRKLVETRRVAIGGILCLDERRPLQPGEVVTVHAEPLPPLPTEKDVRVIYCDSALAVVEKPARMVTLRHRTELSWPQWRKALHPTLDDLLPRLIARYLPNRPAHSIQLHSVHRIDRDTSGLLVFALQLECQEKLIAQFAHHDVSRLYRTIVPGQLAERTITSQLVRDRGDGLRGSSTDPAEGERAVTHIRPVSRLGSKYSELECRLETGRTHQIRIHLAEQGHPVCGDLVYRGRVHAPQIIDHSGAPRMALHAAQLGFDHPITGQALHFETGWPVDLDRFQSRLRGSQNLQHRNEK